MSSHASIHVAVVAQPPLAGRLRGALVAAGFEVCHEFSLARDGIVDCLVSDVPLVGLPDAWQAAIREYRVACIVLGADGPPALSLPSDATPRELALACRLWTEQVGLRRQLAATTTVAVQSAREARTDALTGLGNRRTWDEQLKPGVAEALNVGQTVCVAILDVDLFKAINDTHGHAVGDRVLACCGEALRAASRPTDLVCRLGGDEFGLLLVGLPREAAKGVVERLRTAPTAALKESGLPLATLSAGYRLLMPDEVGASASEGWVTADDSLHQAKRTGRNRTIAAEEWLTDGTIDKELSDAQARKIHREEI